MLKTVPIKSNRDFLKLYKKGNFYTAKYLVLYTMPNNLNINRIGITVGRKLGKSVRRNRIKRLIRENYRLIEKFVKEGMDILFVARPSETLPEFYDIKNEMEYLLKKSGLFKQEKQDCLENS